MSTTAEATQADEAKSALITDIKELKGAGQHAVTRAKSALPWVIGGAVGLVVVGAIAMKPARRSSAPPSLLGKLVRAAALSALSILARRLMSRAVDKALPEPETAKARASA
ncbi:MAG: hypothetical protein ABUL62_16975 [Myxococcales bacterium]|jgi:hypothetical protein